MGSCFGQESVGAKRIERERERGKKSCNFFFKLTENGERRSPETRQNLLEASDYES